MVSIFIAIIIILVGIIFGYDKLKSIAAEKEAEEERRMIAAKEADHSRFMEKMERNLKMIALSYQAKVMGDIDTYQQIMDNKYNGPLPERRGDGGWLSVYDDLRILKIAGVEHRGDLSSYMNGMVDCVLVAEPENEYDANAIKVISSDRRHIGYIAASQTDFVRSMVGTLPYKCHAIIGKDSDIEQFCGFVYIKRMNASINKHFL